MNILELEDVIKGLPDNRLVQEAQAPTGRLPQFLVVSEIQRRSDMRRRFQSQQEQPKGTVAQQILSGGIGSLPQTSFTPPSPVAASAAPPPSALTGAGEAPIMMSQGGLTLDDLRRRLGGYPPFSLLRDPEQEGQEDAGSEPASAPQSADLQELSATGREVQALASDPFFANLLRESATTPDFDAAKKALVDLQGQPVSVVDYSRFIDANTKAAKKYADEYRSLGDIYMAEAEKEAQSIRAQAKKDALTAALMQIGAGVAAGDVATGLSGAATAVQESLSQAEKEALAERRAGRISGREAAESARRLGIGAEQSALEIGMRGEEARVAGKAQEMSREFDIASRLAELGLQQSQFASEAENRRIQSKRDMAISLFGVLNQQKTQGRISDRAMINAIKDYINTSVTSSVGLGDPQAARRNAAREAIALFGWAMEPGQIESVLEAFEGSGGSAEVRPQTGQVTDAGMSASDVD